MFVYKTRLSIYKNDYKNDKQTQDDKCKELLSYKKDKNKISVNKKESIKEYRCECCNYYTKFISNYNRHIKSKKHN